MSIHLFFQKYKSKKERSKVCFFIGSNEYYQARYINWIPERMPISTFEFIDTQEINTTTNINLLKSRADA